MRSTSSLGRVAILGDSLSLLTDRSGLPVKTPGSLLAFKLRGTKGVESVFVDAVGGFALSYFRPKVAHTKYGQRAAQMLKNADKQSPDTVLVLLGTNDYAQPNAAVMEGIAAIRSHFSKPGQNPELIFVGPPDAAPEAKGGAYKKGIDRVYKQLEGSLRPLIDTRPMTRDLLRPPGRAKDMVHFSSRGAELYASRMKEAIAGRQNVKRTSKIGMGEVLIGIGLLELLLSGPLTKLLKRRA